VAVPVRCPKCSAFCQVQKEHLGHPVRCPQCSQVFVTASEQAPAPGSGGFWHGLKGLVRNLTTPTLRPAPPSEGDLELQLDGPAAAAQEPAPSTGPPRLALEIGSATTTGRVRQRNEDCVLIQHLSCTKRDGRHELALLVVADGMGGYEAGDRASALIVRHIGEAFAPVFARASTQLESADDLAGLLQKTIKSANSAVLREAQTDAHCKGMGATLAALIVADDQVRIGHVGDCRVYHFHDGALKQVTRDQTLVARMVDLGTLTPQEARTHPQRNEVTQAVGKHTDIRPEPYQLQLEPGDWLIAASDGLHAHVNEEGLLAAVLEGKSAAALAGHLVNLADEAGGSDNTSVVALRYG
jgi:serine/threonine protein phosphatase PrpC